jgi:hypothetical protein
MGPPLSDNVYVPVCTAALVTAGAPLAPLIGVGPVACNVQSVGAAVPPLSFVTVLTSVSEGWIGSLSVALLQGGLDSLHVGSLDAGVGVTVAKLTACACAWPPRSESVANAHAISALRKVRRRVLLMGQCTRRSS